MPHLVMCVAYAVLSGILGLLLIAVIEWMLGFLSITITAEIKRLLQAAIALCVIIQLLLCVFGGGRSLFLGGAP